LQDGALSGAGSGSGSGLERAVEQKASKSSAVLNCHSEYFADV
jgi:hypothetical protein